LAFGGDDRAEGLRAELERLGAENPAALEGPGPRARETAEEAAAEHALSLGRSLASLRDAKRRLDRLDDDVRVLTLQAERYRQAAMDARIPAEEREKFGEGLSSRNHYLEKSKEEQNAQKAAYDSQRKHYEALLTRAAGYDEAYLESLLDMAFQEIKGDDFYARELKICLGIVKKNAEMVRGGADASQIPESILEEMPEDPRSLGF
jgi:hypothetical protein